jgi:hypothetical protein
MISSSAQLYFWKEQLPPDVDIDINLPTNLTATPHRIMLHLTYWQLFILLHRPFYQRKGIKSNAEKNIDHVKASLAARFLVSLLIV